MSNDDLNGKLASCMVSLKAAEASRDVAIKLVERCQGSYAMLEKELRAARDMAKGIFMGVTIDAPTHLERQRKVCENWTTALKNWLVTKPKPGT